MTFEDAKRSLDWYVDVGLRPGSFLTAVLTNDLRTAVSHADPGALAALPQIVRHVYSQLPGESCGSEARVQAWINSRGRTGR